MKKLLKRGFVYLYLSVFISLIFSATVFAYLDPATTSYLIQIVSGVVIACGVTVGIFWKKIKLFFKKIKIKALEKKYAKQGKKREQQKKG